jgi:hypothetical protein
MKYSPTSPVLRVSLDATLFEFEALGRWDVESLRGWDK